MGTRTGSSPGRRLGHHGGAPWFVGLARDENPDRPRRAGVAPRRRRTGVTSEAVTRDPAPSPEKAVLPVANPDAELPPRRGGAPAALVGHARLATLAAVVVPLLGLVAAPSLPVGLGLRLGRPGPAAGHVRPRPPWASRSASTGCSSTAPSRRTPVVKFVLAVLGSMAVQGPLFKWVALHRRHHQHSDTPDDPHSPHHHGRGRPRLAAGLLARPHRLVLRARPAGPGPLRQGPRSRAARCAWPAPCSRCGWPSAC